MRLDDYDPGDDVRDLGRSGGGLGGGGFGGAGLGGGGGLGSLIGLLPLLFGRRMGFGGIILVLVIGFVVMNMGSIMSGAAPAGTVNPGQSRAGASAPGSAGTGGGANVACDTPEERFACNVFGNTHTVWEQIFAQSGQRYSRPTLNFFTDQNQSGCGAAQSAMGPFYCPTDRGVYLDTAFFRELSQRFAAAGDAAQAYVIAHEVGHHVQTLTGISDQVRAAQQRSSEAEGNAYQVKMELQADCYAGVWANLARTRDGQRALEPGDMEEAMRAANAIGDDTLMRGAGQRPMPESFTHGTSEQRMRWLRRGMEGGDWRQCDTFRGPV